METNQRNKSLWFFFLPRSLNRCIENIQPASLHWSSKLSFSCILSLDYLCRASLIAQLVKNLPAMQETWVQSLSWEDSLKKEMATHSTILAWRIPWIEKLDRLQSMGSQESDTTERLNHHQQRMLSQKERRTCNKYCSQDANQEAGVIIKIQGKQFHSNELDKNKTSACFKVSTFWKEIIKIKSIFIPQIKHGNKRIFPCYGWQVSGKSHYPHLGSLKVRNFN